MHMIRPLGCQPVPGPKIYSLHLYLGFKLGRKLQTASLPVFEVAGSKKEGIVSFECCCVRLVIFDVLPSSLFPAATMLQVSGSQAMPNLCRGGCLGSRAVQHCQGFLHFSRLIATRKRGSMMQQEALASVQRLVQT